MARVSSVHRCGDGLTTSPSRRRNRGTVERITTNLNHRLGGVAVDDNAFIALINEHSLIIASCIRESAVVPQPAIYPYM